MPSKFKQVPVDVEELVAGDLVEFTYKSPKKNGVYRCGFVEKLDNNCLHVADFAAEGGYRQFKINKVSDISLLTPVQYRRDEIDKYTDGLKFLKNLRGVRVIWEGEKPTRVENVYADLSLGQKNRLKNLGWFETSDGVWVYNFYRAQQRGVGSYINEN